ncbi:sugar transferase [Gordonia rubripertincta]|uniref:Sugar transferase n=2 Tax=Gordonia rubripertincta TaxID=36822 RepID=A0AAW6RH96_GORRU|nr:sugar transferase [Gordonia rubripertincta]MDG6783826.1 sugar transferase [Gordonia rubripertincta]NKY64408.1 sugar transferase [Gordonia rubripertincta]GAB84230.1 putative glycosyltransferase [Gordonia rubripertincta NBRC 101908]
MAYRPAYDGSGRGSERTTPSLRYVSRGRDRSRSWIHGYVVRLAWTDAAIVAFAVTVAQLARFGADNALTPNGAAQVPAALVSVLLGLTWILALRAFQTLDRRIVGSGSQEYSRVVTGCLAVFGVLAMVDLLFRLNIARGFVAIALPVGTAALLLSRWLWRQRLGQQRLQSKNLEHVLVVGSAGSAFPMIERLLRQPNLGYRVVGICLPTRIGYRDSVTVGGTDISVFGTFDDVSNSVLESGATTVAVTSAEALGHDAMQALSWDLEGLDVDMMVSPGVTDVAGPRVMVRPVAGLPLLHIDKPRYEGANRFRKALVDRVGAALILTCLAPVLAAVAVAIKLDSPGPVFYRANRVGLNNAPFSMWKFRSMVQDADAQKDKLRAQNEGSGVLFKIRDDPRVTRVGTFIRRFSIDELPQLFNVLGGTMSLVGPRPPLPDEVDRYDGRVARRMLVKPGMTGLWQVSGRSDLSWEESVRLDLSYVENWSIMQDALILWRTVKAVVAKDGAY